MLSFDRLKPNFSSLYRQKISDKPNLTFPFQYLNFHSGNWQGLSSTHGLVPLQKPYGSNSGFEYHKYRKTVRFVCLIGGSSYVYCMKNDDSPEKTQNDDDTDDSLSTISSNETESSTFDPFDDDNVVYYQRKYSYESPSRDNTYYYEIKSYRHPNNMENLPKSIESQIKSEMESFFKSPFYAYVRRIRDRFNGPFENVAPVVYSNGENNKNDVKMDPFWVVLTKTAPAKFSNAFITVCGTVFALWKFAENSVNQKFSDFMTNHFVASYEGIKSKRFHTLLTSAISHSSFLHFGLNCMFFHQLMKTFHNNMALQSTPVNTTLQSFVRSFFSANHIFPASNTTRLNKGGGVNTNDIFNVLFLSAIVSSLGHVMLYKTPVLGASGAISGLMYLLASTFPNSYFKTVFPLPGLNLSILQIGQLFVATNLYFLVNVKGSSIAWAAHLLGMGGGALYCLFQQYVNRRPGFYNPILLSLRTAKSQWKSTFQGFGKG